MKKRSKSSETVDIAAEELELATVRRLVDRVGDRLHVLKDQFDRHASIEMIGAAVVLDDTITDVDELDRILGAGGAYGDAE
jgi:hypothetical protein